MKILLKKYEMYLTIVIMNMLCSFFRIFGFTSTNYMYFNKNFKLKRYTIYIIYDAFKHN